MAKPLHPLDVRRAGDDKLDPQKRVRVRDLGPRPDGSVRRAEEINQLDSPPKAPARRTRTSAASGPWGETTEARTAAQSFAPRERRQAQATDQPVPERRMGAGSAIFRVVMQLLILGAVYLAISAFLGGSGAVMNSF